jgi:hypothetical protein
VKPHQNPIEDRRSLEELKKLTLSRLLGLKRAIHKAKGVTHSMYVQSDGCEEWYPTAQAKIDEAAATLPYRQYAHDVHAEIEQRTQKLKAATPVLA